jgi:hypothetical protein
MLGRIRMSDRMSDMDAGKPAPHTHSECDSCVTLVLSLLAR